MTIYSFLSPRWKPTILNDVHTYTVLWNAEAELTCLRNLNLIFHDAMINCIQITGENNTVLRFIIPEIKNKSPSPFKMMKFSWFAILFFNNFYSFQMWLKYLGFIKFITTCHRCLCFCVLFPSNMIYWFKLNGRK